MDEAIEPTDFDAEIEAVRTAEGFNGLNNFRANLPGGYRYKVLQEDMEFGNNKTDVRLKGLSLREFAVHEEELIKTLNLDQEEVLKLQEGFVKSGDKMDLQKLNDYVFPLYRELRKEGFNHKDLVE